MDPLYEALVALARATFTGSLIPATVVRWAACRDCGRSFADPKGYEDPDKHLPVCRVPLAMALLAYEEGREKDASDTG